MATPFGEGAIALLRLSGPEAVQVLERVFFGRVAAQAMPSRVQHFGQIRDEQGPVDDVLVSVFHAPASYTGEEMVEITCHGGILVTRKILELLLRHGAEAAGPGEFTQRAFLNGKMDLTQAEAVMDLISAQTELALRAAHEQLEGKLGQRLNALRDDLLSILAHVEAYIDFPDEDISPDTGAALNARLGALLEALQALLGTAERGAILREGLRTVIYGAPNVGKSSLLNLLLGYERAIVSPTPGTTRDALEEVIDLRGIPLRLVDTAGIREAADPVERAGIERTRQQMERAGLVLHLFDAQAERPTDWPAPKEREILVLNKIDLGEHSSWAGVPGVRISCRAESGLAALEEAILARVSAGGVAQRDWSAAINVRHRAHLEAARAQLETARAGLASGLSAEFVAEDLRGALGSLGDIVGRVDSEDLLGQIFSSFCIGK